MKEYIFTSEHVSPGHPDKLCDAVAEGIVDHYIETYGPRSRVGVDGLVKSNKLIIAGEISAPKILGSHKEIVDVAIIGAGYNPTQTPKFHAKNLVLEEIFTTQSPDIALGVDHNPECEAAGDIGIMFGGAVREAPDYTAWSHYISRLLSFELHREALSGAFVNWAKPDQKVQVSILYQDDKPVAIDSIVVCISHKPVMEEPELTATIAEFVEGYIQKYAVSEKWDIEYSDYKLIVNPTGAFTVFGPEADSGAVGRKIVCDQYGGYFPVGGGNLNGKDPTKVDRSAVYMARKVSRSVVESGFADKCQIQLSYAIGQVDPVSIHIDTFGTEKVPITQVEEFVRSYSFRPGDMINYLRLTTPIAVRGFSYQALGMYGHIGRRFEPNTELPWEI